MCREFLRSMKVSVSEFLLPFKQWPRKLPLVQANGINIPYNVSSVGSHLPYLPDSQKNILLTTTTISGMEDRSSVSIDEVRLTQVVHVESFLYSLDYMQK